MAGPTRRGVQRALGALLPGGVPAVAAVAAPPAAGPAVQQRQQLQQQAQQHWHVLWAWSAAAGHQQVPWARVGALLPRAAPLPQQQAPASQRCHSSAVGEAPAGSAPSQPQQAAPASALNFDDAPPGPPPPPPPPQQQQQQQQQQQRPAAAADGAPGAPGSGPARGGGGDDSSSALAGQLAASFAASAMDAGVLEQPGRFMTLLPLVCSSGGASLAPWQQAAAPTLAQLQQQERTTLLSGRGFRLRSEAHNALDSLLGRFVRSSKRLREAAHSEQLPKTLLAQAAGSFRRFLLRAATPGLTAALLVAAAPPSPAPGATAAALAAPPSFSYTPAVEALLLPHFVGHMRQHYAQEIAAYAAAVATLDLRSPQSWYAYARSIRRTIVYHAGPTNSGKTYAALQSLAAAPRGVYCAPLRLLAMEVYETLNGRGVYCDLVTGQEVLKVPGSSHVSCTVEMASLNSHADVAVIDEIQLIGDEQRGFAWTRALLGLPANTLHVCGDASALRLVAALAGLCGDAFEAHAYERMTPLHLDPQGLPNGWADVAPGDALVAFSRRSIYNARRAVEAATGLRTCIVYGALPAETRRHQARLFNNPASGVDVLIASDAIGLGLNFNIRRVVFTTLKKRGRGGRGATPVPASLVKQIAGRAGRRNSIYPTGSVTTLHPDDLPSLAKALALPPSALYTPAAGLAPEYETVELLAAQFPGLSLQGLLRKLDAEARLDGRFFLCRQQQLLETARVLEQVPGLSLADQFTLVNAPIDVWDEQQRSALLGFVGAYAAGQPVVLNTGLMPGRPPGSELEMAEAENLHKIFGLWLWLSFRFEEGAFPGRERVQALARQLCHWLNIGLASIQAPQLPAPAAADAAADAAGAADKAGAAAAGKAADAAADAAAGGADSSDADDINQSVFSAAVLELPAGAAQLQGELQEQLQEEHGPEPAGPLEQQQAQAQAQAQQQARQWQEQEAALRRAARRQEREARKRQREAPYIRWGSSVACGLVEQQQQQQQQQPAKRVFVAASDAAAAAAAAAASQRQLPLLAGGGAGLLECGDGGGAEGASVEALEQLLMPEFEASMAPFVRWRARPRFRVPSPPPREAAAAAAAGRS